MSTNAGKNILFVTVSHSHFGYSNVWLNNVVVLLGFITKKMVKLERGMRAVTQGGFVACALGGGGGN